VTAKPSLTAGMEKSESSEDGEEVFVIKKGEKELDTDSLIELRETDPLALDFEGESR